ncbi:MAG: hypothetical protein IPM16_10455 [Chloroflexi bacterium]|nr:hypothetical protein [Chloroflexota bacterium]
MKTWTNTLVALCFLAAILTGAVAALRVFEKVIIRGIVVDDIDSMATATTATLGISINGSMIGLITTSADLGEAKEFEFRVANSFGFANDFPGESIVVDVGRVHMPEPVTVVVNNVIVTVDPAATPGTDLVVPPHPITTNAGLVVTSGALLVSSLLMHFAITPRLRPSPRNKMPRSSSVPKEPVAMESIFLPEGIKFLIRVGDFAMKRLKKTWKAQSRVEVQAAPLDLNDRRLVTDRAPGTLQAVEADRRSKLLRRMEQLQKDLDVLELQFDALDRAVGGGKVIAIHEPVQRDELETRQNALLDNIKKVAADLGFDLSEG